LEALIAPPRGPRGSIFFLSLENYDVLSLAEQYCSSIWPYTRLISGFVYMLCLSTTLGSHQGSELLHGSYPKVPSCTLRVSLRFVSRHPRFLSYFFVVLLLTSPLALQPLFIQSRGTLHHDDQTIQIKGCSFAQEACKESPMYWINFRP
jgi:hypothetical protein